MDIALNKVVSIFYIKSYINKDKMEYNVEKYGEKKVFSEQCQQFMKDKLDGRDIYSLSLEELKTYKEDLEHLIEENSMLELCSKL